MLARPGRESKFQSDICQVFKHQQRRCKSGTWGYYYK